MFGVQTWGIGAVKEQVCFVLQVWAGGIEMSVLASSLPAATRVPGLVLSFSLSFSRNLAESLKALIPCVLQES